jgi:hypothetical protein
MQVGYIPTLRKDYIFINVSAMLTANILRLAGIMTSNERYLACSKGHQEVASIDATQVLKKNKQTWLDENPWNGITSCLYQPEVDYANSLIS